MGSLAVAEPVLEELEPSLTAVERAMPYLTRFPVEIDPSPFPGTIRFRQDQPASQPLPEWWGGDQSRLVYVTFGTVLGHMTIAAGVYGAPPGGRGAGPPRAADGRSPV